MSIQLPDNWWLAYLGKPWQAEPNPPHSYNCGELVRAVHIDMVGIDSPTIPIENPYVTLQCAKAMQPLYYGLLPLEEGQEPHALDVAFIGRKSCLAHCGMAVETFDGLRLLHCPQTAAGVVLDDFYQLRLMGYPAVRWFRHKDLHTRLQERGWLK